MFSKRGVYEPCGLFSLGHLILFSITIIIIIILLCNTKNLKEKEVSKILRISCIIVWTLEIIKIIFVLQYTSLSSVNEYVPLYFCSMLLYSLLLSNMENKYLKRVGNVFLATGSIAGGLIFMIIPTTSLPTYPVFHFISLHSFFFHGMMLYLGLLINITGYIKLNNKDIYYYASLVFILCILALIVNTIFDSNLMFISKDFPNTPLHIIYKISGVFYTPLMIIGQMILPYYLVKIIMDKLHKLV